MPALIYTRRALVLFCLVLWLPGFFVLPPTDRDESRFAQATKQMTETGDYVRIMNGSASRNKKPVGIHWLQAPFVLTAGPQANPIWPYRVPSLLGGIAAVLAAYELALLFWRSRQTAALAGSMLACSLLLTVETHIAKTDAALLGATSVAMAVLARAWMGAKVTPVVAAVFWLSLAGGILLKGPITPMVAGLAIAGLGLTAGNWRWLRALRAGWGVPLMVACVSPWFVAIEIATKGAFLAQAADGDLGNKLAGGTESHGGFPGLHLLLLPLLAFPATQAVIAALPGAWAARRQAAERFLLAWLIPSWLVFEAVPTKLPHYPLPLYPALFLLAARGLTSGDAMPPRWVRGVARAALVLAAALIAGGVLALPVFLGDAWYLGLPAAVLVAAMGALAWRGRMAWALLAGAGFSLCLLQFELPNLSELWIAPQLERLLGKNWPSFNKLGNGLVISGYAEPSVVFECGTRITIFAYGDASADMLFHHKATLAVVEDRELPRFMAEAAKRSVAVHAVGRVRGFNYSRGRWAQLTLFAP